MRRGEFVSQGNETRRSEFAFPKKPILILTSHIKRILRGFRGNSEGILKGFRGDSEGKLRGFRGNSEGISRPRKVDFSFSAAFLDVARRDSLKMINERNDK